MDRMSDLIEIHVERGKERFFALTLIEIL